MDHVGARQTVPIVPFFEYEPLYGRSLIYDRSQILTLIERPSSDARHAVQDGDRSQPGATEERKVPDARRSVQDHALVESNLVANIKIQYFDNL